ncbi:uncharacterized protein FFB20_15192 [Fusarium fujikuroi]|nr:uncharacterized protein FFC1_03080 [Fusarium fujikuroi]SCN85247.1 uncharacterized protein FFE2_05630 [Fusarium fujikuroi]SCN91575.1 uncharacterized protein FFM5_05077 [Fusarium fujikuroi]SCO17281.1 uncharacterized protein FFB20_15192 [Fusarium fujikuroi]SCO31849.1 uncharacterized protein FFNC_02536 [Fusarium fujikuroi]
MKIESILNQFSELDTEARDSRESPHLFNEQKEHRGPSLSLSTPSPDCTQSRTSSVRSDSRTRTPWDAGGYSLPRDIGPKNSSRPPFTPVTWEEQQESARRQNASNYHSRQVSMETSASINLHGSAGSYALPVRRMPSTPEVHQDAWAPKSNHSERRASQHMRRSSLWTEYNTSPASGSHKISDSRSSFSSCCSSTFSAGHSRFSSVSTINGSNTVGSGIADLEAKLERLPRITAPLPPVTVGLSAKPHARQRTNGARSLYAGSPSDTILEARMMRRKHNHLSEDQTYLKPKDQFLNSLDRVHKRTISAPNPAQGSSHSFPQAPTSLPQFTSRQLRPPTQLSPQINTSHDRLGVEKYPWIHTGEGSPAPSSASTKSPFHPPETVRMQSNGTLPGASGQAASHANQNDRVLAALHTLENVTINVPLKGGDICMAVPECNTDSVPRKVISHIFGRNKVCTRRIPERVWVCMCRKHYQRIRYRTGIRFSYTQINLVYEQIIRMIFWSRGLENASRTNQEGITIRSWTFSIRRREVKRLADTNSRDPIPHWIMQSLGEGKTHDEILDVIERLCQEIDHGDLREVPPVEFLPEVVDAFTNPPAQVQIHQTSASSQSSRSSLMAGEAVPSPLPFVKESSPLKPVQEEGSASEHSSQQSSSSPTPPAAFNGSRPAHHSRSYTDDISNRPAPYSFGSRSPLANTGIGPDTDRQPSLGYYDSQNPTAPSMSYSSINRHMQAPMTDHRGSCDNAPYYQQSYGGDHYYDPNGFVLTDRNLSIHTAAMPMLARADQMYGTAGYAAQHSRNNHFLASTVNTQLTPAPLNYPSYGTPPFQASGAGYSYPAPEERHSQLRMSGLDNSLHHSMADERPYTHDPRSQIHQPNWFSAETGSNTRIGRSMNQYQQHTLASVDQASLRPSRQYPNQEVPEYGFADLVTDEGVPTTQPAVAYRPRFQYGYASPPEFDDTLARGNYQAYQHNLSTNGDEDNIHGDRASDSDRQ